MKSENIIDLMSRRPVGETEEMSLRTKKVTTAFSLASLALVVLLVNQQLISDNNSKQGSNRGIASLDRDMGAAAEQLAWEHELAKGLAQGSERIPASLRSRPTEVQKLAFGYLEGKYSLLYDEGKISEISFVNSVNRDDRPKYIEHEKFLTDYQSLWAAEFELVRAKSESKEGEHAVRTYELLDQGQEAVGVAEFITDPEGRLLRMRISKI